jgi:hypothetical protein
MILVAQHPNFIVKGEYLMNNLFKKTIVSGLTLAMVLGGGASAFADSKGKGNDKDDKNRDRDRGKIEAKWDGKGDMKLEFKLSFDDVLGGDVEWASRYIASLASKRVFEGYEDGTFQPRKTISRIEAITAAVRLMGLREQAESEAAKATDLNFSDEDRLRAKYPWAVGYVAVAVQNDLFAESDAMVQPEKEADRLWATTLLVKAMKLEAEAKAKMNAKLTFKDAAKIPAGSVGYVAVALERKLIEGYEDNTFRPNQPVTRAELAALLDRTGTLLPDNASVRGTVTATVYNNNLLTISTQKQANVTVELDPNAFIFRSGVKVAASALQTGDEVLIRTYNSKAIYVEVTKLATEQQRTDFTVSGSLVGYPLLNASGEIAQVTVTSAAASGGTQTVPYNVSANLKIEGNPGLLTNGQAVELKGQNGLIHTITVK